MARRGVKTRMGHHLRRMVRGVRKKQVRSVAECSSRRKKHTGNSKRLKLRKKPVDHDIETASETDFDVNKDVGKRQNMKKCPRDTHSESFERINVYG
ncbi:hypothetical protein OROHE_009300 [Orobanche hederae]